MLETDLVDKMMVALRKEFKGKYIKIHGGPYQITGVSDIIGIQKLTKGRNEFIAIEAKLPDNNKGPWKNGTTARQDLFLLDVRERNGKCGVARNVEEALEIARGNLIYAGEGVNKPFVGAQKRASGRRKRAPGYGNNPPRYTGPF